MLGGQYISESGKRVRYKSISSFGGVLSSVAIPAQENAAGKRVGCSGYAPSWST